MRLRIFNTMGRRLEEFKPQERGVVRLYTCGPTVYDYAHIGNFRTFVFQDVLRRYLKFKGFQVIQVMNITDVDDKTIRGAQANGISLKEYTRKYEQAFFEDLEALRIERAEHYPRATEHVPQMVELIKQLVAKGYAYQSEGSWYYDVSKFAQYGALSGITGDQLKPTGRVKADSYSKDEVRDFALWKAWDPDDGDVYWETELGKGRPGWHIECSAMAMHYLGETLDIHSGGVDLIFPHHENEIAQSEAATGKRFVRYWIHVEHLLVEGQKMAKSLGNYYTLRDLLARGYSPTAIRFLLLSAHYRRHLNFTFEALRQAERAVERLNDLAARLRAIRSRGPRNPQVTALCQKLLDEFTEAMDNDFNLPQALAALFDFVKEVNRLIDAGAVVKGDAEEALHTLRRIDQVLAVMELEEELPEEVQRLIEEREEARRRRDWVTADRLREEIRARGYIIEDTPQGVKWRRKA
jgi:cysteinyl-tRNA synthetase